MSAQILKDSHKNTSVLYKGHEYPDLSFIGGEYLIFLVKKSENFVRAVYIVTNFIKDTEPLKWRLRTVATDLLNELMSFIKDDKDKTSEHLYRARFFGCLSTLVSLLNIGTGSGVVSEANTVLLKREINSFFPHLGGKVFALQTHAPVLPLLGDNFTVPTKKLARKGHRRASSFSLKEVGVEAESSLSAEEKSQGHSKLVTDTKRRGPKKINEIKAKERSQRQKVIIDILKDKKTLSAKELMSLTRDLKWKTVQRELVYLSERGVLRRMGKKRWSSYSFVQPLLGV